MITLVNVTKTVKRKFTHMEKTAIQVIIFVNTIRLTCVFLLDEATQKKVNSNEGWGTSTIQQSTKWNVEGIKTRVFGLMGHKDQLSIENMPNNSGFSANFQQNIQTGITEAKALQSLGFVEVCTRT